MSKEADNRVKIKIKSQKDDFSVIIKAKVDSSEAVPFADMMIEQMKASGFKAMGESLPTVETKEAEKQSEPSTPVCPIHNKELVKRKGQYGEFWACPTKDEQGNWCQWRPEKKKQK